MARALSGAVGRWAAEWQATTDLVPLAALEEAACAPAHDGELTGAIAAADWQALRAGADAGVWWALTEQRAGVSKDEAVAARRSAADARAAGLRATLPAVCSDAAPALAGVDGPQLADELAAAAWDDWLTVLGAACAVSAAAAPTTVRSVLSAVDGLAQATAPWGGGLRLRLAWCGRGIDVLLGADAVTRMLAASGHDGQATQAASPPPPAAATPVLQALGYQTLALSVELAPLEMTLGTLADLRLDDVLCTTHDLARPLSVRAGASGHALPLCDAYLGRKGALRAVELTAPTLLSPAHP